MMNFRVVTSGQTDIGSQPVGETLHFSLPKNLPIEIAKICQSELKFKNSRKTSRSIFLKHKVKWNNYNIKLTKGIKM